MILLRVLRGERLIVGIGRSELIGSPAILSDYPLQMMSEHMEVVTVICSGRIGRENLRRFPTRLTHLHPLRRGRDGRSVGRLNLV
jgi:hypothetical protein